MLRSTIRTLLRRQIQEETPHNWDDSTLNDLINAGLQLTYKELVRVAPELLLEWARRNVITTDDYYALPSNALMLDQVRMLISGKYQKLEYKDFETAEGWTGTTPVWTRRGGYVGIFPRQTVAITNGLEIIYVPVLTLAVDTDVPPIPLPLHLAIVYMTKVLALGETYQNFDRDVKVIEKTLGDFGTYFLPVMENLKWQPDVRKALGYEGS